ncbi:MAG: drug/metabolite exporter YedA [Burkholderiales bacterium]|nr:drug/metabolite exporter YedA [Burkholderiales bacterium]
MLNRPASILVPCCLAATWLVWGSTYLVIKFALVSFAPYVLSGMRYLTAGTALLVFARWRGSPWPSWRQTRNAALIGFLMLTVGNGLTCVAEKTLPSGATALIVAVTPLMAVVINHFLGTRSTLIEAVGIVCGMVGIGIMNFDSSLAGDPRAAGLMGIACLSWALASAIIRRIALPEGAMSSAVQMIAGGLISLPLALIIGERFPASPTWGSVAALAYLSVFGSIIAYSAFVWLLRNVRPALATSSSYVNPVVALLLGTVFLNEAVTWPLVAGITIILVGMVLISRGGRG